MKMKNLKIIDITKIQFKKKLCQNGQKEGEIKKKDKQRQDKDKLNSANLAA